MAVQVMDPSLADCRERVRRYKLEPRLGRSIVTDAVTGNDGTGGVKSGRK